MQIDGVGRREAATKVKRFVRGAHRLTISSEALAELLGVVEHECRLVLDDLCARGLLRKISRRSSSPLYCKE